VTRVAAIDLGTNSTRLLVADVGDGHVEDVLRRSVVTRLGEGVDARRRLLPTPIARVRNTLSDFRRELESLGAERTLAIATSAVRDAENGEAFLGEIEWSYGFTTRLLSGDDEAELTRIGVGALAAGSLVLDVGGGSTELIAGEFRTSLDVGSVRLTERFLHGDPPAPAELEAAAAHVREQLPSLDVREAIAVGGTAAQLAELVEGGELTVDQVEQQLHELAALPLARRQLRAAQAELARRGFGG
jgi:exopolyphosphatase/guanosine-5'-triphosphate,3'-diphosphate pyrophosphatase